MPGRLKSRLLVSTEDFSPTRRDFRVVGAFNPGATRFNGDIVLLVRVAESCALKEPGFLYSPRALVAQDEPEYAVDRLEIAPGGGADHRKPLLADGHRRLAFVSHIEMVRLAPDGYALRDIARHDELFGRTDYEIYGVEDARITEIEGTYYITYVSVSDRMGVATSLMTTVDFKRFDRHGVIFSCENKDVVLFPEKQNGRFRCYHRPVGRINIRSLSIMEASSPDALDWGHHHYVLGCAPGTWYSGRMGAGTPPVRTRAGWLSIFHGVRYAGPSDPIGTYAAGALLCHIDRPWEPVAVSAEPFLVPTEDYEKTGYVNNVVFPTGAVRDIENPDLLHVYCGCADTAVSVVTFSIDEILSSLVPAGGTP
ncbi:MAG: glycosylase [Planctomycetes bacterium]|nr:glycosylase [Planctomycetota bacterium]